MQAVEAVGRAEKGVKDSRQVAQHEHAEIYASVRLQSNGLSACKLLQCRRAIGLATHFQMSKTRLRMQTQERASKLPGSKMPSDNGDLEKGCREALAQIEAVGYCDRLRQDGMETVLRYGVACSGKRCAVRGI